MQANITGKLPRKNTPAGALTVLSLVVKQPGAVVADQRSTFPAGHGVLSV
jgi:hypothetical protein